MAIRRATGLDVDVAPPAHDTPPRGAVFGLLRDHRDYRTLWLGTLAAQAGQWILQVALGWLMLDLTDSEFWVGLVGFAGGLPILLFSIPAGVAIDRVDRRKLLVGCQAALTVLAAGLALLAAFGNAAPWQLLVGAFLNGAGMTISNATRQTIVPGTTPRADLPAAIALMSAGQNATRVVGPSLAGAIIGVAGIAGAFVVQASALSIALALTMMLSANVAASGVVSATRGGLLDGWHYVRARPVPRDLIMLAAIPTLTVFPYIQLLPVFARDILKVGPQGLGLLMAASGVGAVIGSLLVAKTARMSRMGYFLLVSTIVYGLIIAGFAFSTSVWLSLPLLLLGGLTGSAYMSLNNSLLHLHITDEVRGRVMGVYMLTWGLMPLGALPMGLAANYLGAPAAVAGGALLSSTLTLLLATRSRTLRAL